MEPTDGELIAKILEDAFGMNNPKGVMGEVRVKNQYVVGAEALIAALSKTPPRRRGDIIDDTGGKKGSQVEELTHSHTHPSYSPLV